MLDKDFITKYTCWTVGCWTQFESVNLEFIELRDLEVRGFIVILISHSSIYYVAFDRRESDIRYRTMLVF